MSSNELWKSKNYLDQRSSIVRDPLSIGSLILGGLGASSAFLGTGLGMLLAGTVGYLVSTTITSWALAALNRNKGGSQTGGTLVNVKDPAAPVEFVYGKVRKGGVITYLETTGDDNKYLHMILVLAGHEIDAIEQIYLDDTPITLNGSNMVIEDPWTDKIRIIKHLGTDDQTVDTLLDAESSVVDSSWRGRGIAYLYVRLEYDQEDVPNAPLITARIRGRKVYDPRTGNTAWSANAALCIRDYLVSPWGGQVEPSTIDDAVSFQVAANNCAEVEGGITRYEINGVGNASQTRRDVLGKMMTACTGTLFFSAGKFKLNVGVYNLPTKTFTAADLRGPVSIDPRITRQSLYNEVGGTFIDAAQDYVVADYPIVRSATFLAEDNNIPSNLDLPLEFTTNAVAAQRIAKVTLKRAREQITCEAPFSLEALTVDIGDTIYLTLPRYGWTNKTFEVVGWKFDAGTEEVPVPKILLTLREISAAVYSVVGGETSIIGNNTNLPRHQAPQAPTGLVLTAGNTQGDDGIFEYFVDLDWNLSPSPYIREYVLKWKRSTETKWQSTILPRRSTEHRVNGLISGKTYTFNLFAVNQLGQISPSAAETVTINKDTTPPAKPTGVVVFGNHGGLFCTWNEVTDADLSRYEIYVGTTTTTPGSSPSGVYIADSNQINIGGFSTATPSVRYIFVRAVDTNGNKSDWSVYGIGTTLVDSNIVNAATLAGLIDATSFAASMRGVEIVSALPGAPHAQNRLVLLTTNLKLYRNTGSGWTNEVDGNDLVSNSVTTGALAAGAVNAEQIAAQAIRATHMLIADTSNLYKDYHCEDLNFYTASGGAAFTNITTSSALLGNRYISVTANGTVTSAWDSLEANEEYYVKAGAWLQTTGTGTCSVYLDVASRSAAGAYTVLSSYLIKSNTLSINTDTSFGENTFVADATAKAFRFRIVGAATSNCRAGGFIIRKKITSTLIVDGAVVAEHISAKSIKARHLEIGDTSNIFPDPLLVDFPNGWVFTTPADYNASIALVTAESVIAASPSKNRIQFPVGGVASTGGPNSPPFCVEASRPYFVSAFLGAYNNGGLTANCTMRLYVRWYSDADATTLISSTLMGETTTSAISSLPPVAGIATAPDTARSARLYMQRVGDAATDGMVISGPVVRRANSGELTVNGSITADHLAAGAITADKLAAGQIIAEEMIVDGATSRQYLLAGGATVSATSHTNPTLVSPSAGKAMTWANYRGDALTPDNPVMIEVSCSISAPSGSTGWIYFALQKKDGATWSTVVTITGFYHAGGAVGTEFVRQLFSQDDGENPIYNGTYRLAAYRVSGAGGNPLIQSVKAILRQLNK